MSVRQHTTVRRPVALAGSVALVAGLCLTTAPPAAALDIDWAFDAPGHSTWTAPEGVTVVEVELWGAAGGLAARAGGAGAYVDDLLEVTPGATYDIYVGGAGAPRNMIDSTVPAGGYNGGGDGGAKGRNGSGAGGGGATDIRAGGTTLADRVVVAAGGGGGSSVGGGNGGYEGDDAVPYTPIDGGGGALQDAGGIGAAGSGVTAELGAGADGDLGVGGAGQYASVCRYTGGGGGGGFYGGGGGGCITNSNGTGGGGGSSLISQDGYVDAETPNPDEDTDGYALIHLLVPDSVEAPDAVAGDRSAEVSWTEPWAGSMEITGYTVTASPGGATCSTDGALSCTVTGLSNGTTYTFTVVATSDVGDSDPSQPSLPVTLPSDGSAPTVSFPARGEYLSRYVVLRSPGSPASRLSTTTLSVCRIDGAGVVFLHVAGTCVVNVTQGGTRVATGSIRVGATGSGTALTTRTVGFRAGSPYLSSTAKAKLAALAPTLRRASVVVVTGWTSGMRTYDSDRALSGERARVVAAYLTGLGVHVRARTAAGAHWLGTSSASRAAEVSWTAPTPV